MEITPEVLTTLDTLDELLKRQAESIERIMKILQP